MNKIQETIDRLKAIDAYDVFYRALEHDNGSPYKLSAHAFGKNHDALCDALGAKNPISYQGKLISLRDRIVELLEEAQASQLPEGVEWPRTDKGELVVFDEPLHTLWDGGEKIDHWWPTKVELENDGTTVIYASKAAKITLKRGERVKTEAPDTQEKIDDDATMNPHYYCKNVLRWDSSKMYTATFQDKIVAMNEDLLRRQRELDARK